MIYSYGGRVDNDSNAITVIDEENITAETKGYVNGEYVEFSGGGGSSDFSTAQVTFINSNDEAEYIPYVPMVQDGDPSCLMTAYTPDVRSDTPCTVNIPLYKGKSSFTLAPFFYVDFDVAPVLTGAITYDASADVLLVEGDGTITLCGTHPDEP